jgi:hypothetical protein
MMILAAYELLSTASATECWRQQTPRRGDHLRVSRGLYNHHGIYISDSEVIHFASLDDDNVLGDNNEVISTPISQFLRGGELEVKIYSQSELQDLYPVVEIERWARGSLGDGGYHLVVNNCEHFANWCTLGRFHSQQVNDVLGGYGMSWGILGKIASGVASFFGSSSDGGGGGGGGSRSSSSESTTNNYNYDPDKVRVAEIEGETAKHLAYHENQRIGLIKDAQLELAEFNARMEAAVIEAKVRGFEVLQKNLLAMTRELNQIAYERMSLLENGSLDVVAKIDQHYDQLQRQIGQEQDQYMQEKMPKLLGLLEQYPEGSTSHKIYNKALDNDMALHIQFQTTQLQSVESRRKLMMDTAVASRLQLEQHINLLVDKRMQHLELAVDNSGQLSPAQLQAYQQQLLGGGAQKQAQLTQAKHAPNAIEGSN